MEAMISKETEVEYKSILSKEQHKKIVNHFKKLSLPLNKYTQVNYYFDTPNFELEKEKITLRIRNKGEYWEITIKVPEKSSKNQLYSKKTEYNAELTKKEAKKILKSKELKFDSHAVLDILAEITNIKPGTTFRLLGELVTERIDFMYGSDIVSLDTNIYNELIDYELEWETNSEKMPKKLKDLGISIGNSSGKRKRFLNTLNKKDIKKIS